MLSVLLVEHDCISLANTAILNRVVYMQIDKLEDVKGVNYYFNLLITSSDDSATGVAAGIFRQGTDSSDERD